MKKIFFIVAVLVLAACSQVSTETQVPTPVVIPTVTIAPTPNPTATSEPVQNPNDEHFIIGNLLVNPAVVWEEGPIPMAENQGGQFGAGADKAYNTAEDVFEFSSPTANGWVPLNTKLDQFGSDRQPGSPQAILFKFIAPEHPAGLILDFMGPNEFGVEFQDGANPGLFWFSEANKEAFPGDFTLEPGKPYNILMAIDQNANFRSLIWENGNYDNHASFSSDFSTRQNGDGYKNQSWKFVIGFDQGDTLKIREYKVFTFEAFH